MPNGVNENNDSEHRKIRFLNLSTDSERPESGRSDFLITGYVYKQPLFFFLYNGIKIIYGTKRGSISR